MNVSFHAVATGGQAPSDLHLQALLDLHTAKRRLVIAMERRRRLGQSIEDIEVELAFNRIRAKTLLAELC